MERHIEFSTTEEEREQRRQERVRRRKARQRQKRRALLLRAVPAACLLLGLALFLLSQNGGQAREDPAAPADQPAVQTAAPAEEPEAPPEPPEEPVDRRAAVTADTALIADDLTSDEMNSRCAVVIDLETNTVLAQKDMDAVISPASMTKLLTLLTAAEAIEDHGSLTDTVTIDFEITDYCYRHDCSVAGFLKDETVTVEQLLYAAILPSGADGALGLAKYVAGDQDAFVALMNEKAEALGIADTAKFANCIGLYDENNVCTLRDMAVILAAVMENDLCRRIVTTKIYEIPASDAHPEGMVLSNWFLRKIEDHVPEGVEVIGGKTGFVDESGSCAASCAQGPDGRLYLCVTADTFSSWRCIKDHVSLYTTYIPGLEHQA